MIVREHINEIRRESSNTLNAIGVGHLHRVTVWCKEAAHNRMISNWTVLPDSSVEAESITLSRRGVPPDYIRVRRVLDLYVTGGGRDMLDHFPDEVINNVQWWDEDYTPTLKEIKDHTKINEYTRVYINNRTNQNSGKSTDKKLVRSMGMDLHGSPTWITYAQGYPTYLMIRYIKAHGNNVLDREAIAFIRRISKPKMNPYAKTGYWADAFRGQNHSNSMTKYIKKLEPHRFAVVSTYKNIDNMGSEFDGYINNIPPEINKIIEDNT